MSKYRDFTIDEVSSIYVARPRDRFVVSLVVGYSEDDGVTDPEAAAAAALRLTRNEGSSDTVWFVYDRKENRMYELEQEDFE